MLTIIFPFSRVSALPRSTVCEPAALKSCRGCKVQLVEHCLNFLSNDKLALYFPFYPS